MLDRRTLLIGSTGLLVAPHQASHSATPFAWERLAPADAGFAPDLEAQIDQFIRSGRARNVHGVVVLRRGRLVLERYYEGDDLVRIDGGRARVERVAFAAERSHEMRSVTKSIVGLLYGIALNAGKVPPLDASLLAQFPYTDLPDMPQRSRWTIRHAITMTLGTDWDEDLPYDDPRNGQTAMEAAPDRYRYVLERPIVAVAGERWIYCSGATALIGKILEKGIGQSLHDYAHAVLFDPLGLGPTEWRVGRDGERNFASGLGMRPRDLARIGAMLLDGGKAGERRVVPSSWLDASFKPAVRVRDLRQYGYHWYLGELGFSAIKGRPRENWIAAMGNGGQRLFVFPELEMVVVVTAGNYARRDRASDDVISGAVLPNLR